MDAEVASAARNLVRAAMYAAATLDGLIKKSVDADELRGAAAQLEQAIKNAAEEDKQARSEGFHDGEEAMRDRASAALCAQADRLEAEGASVHYSLKEVYQQTAAGYRSAGGWIKSLHPAGEAA